MNKEALGNHNIQREHFYEELGLMIQCEAQMTTQIDRAWQGLEAKIAEVMARASRGRGAGTGMGAVKPRKFDRTTS
jgi:hypothetical protein